MEAAGAKDRRGAEARVRGYLVLTKTDELVKLHGLKSLRDAQDGVGAYIARNIPQIAEKKIDLTVDRLPALPSLDPAREKGGVLEQLGSIVCAISIPAKQRDALESLCESDCYGVLLDVGFDAPVFGGRSWCPGPGNGRVFWDRAAADRLINADALGSGASRLAGRGVNVVLVDSGLDAVEWSELGLTQGLRYTSLQHQLYQGQTTPEIARHGHAFVMARQIAALAGEAVVHDYAVLPPRVSKASIPSMGLSLPVFVSDIVAAYADLAAVVAFRKLFGDTSPWVVVNAWSIFRRNWRVGRDLDRPRAWLNRLVALLSDMGVDVVFAAGNCGQFCPDIRCGKTDRGPGFSIVGPAGHPDALTLGAVREDTLWLGYSSQGPGVMGSAALAREKPDICAPSEFRETGDAGFLNTGTSTACALTAAAVAALREKWRDVPPAAMKQALIGSARKIEGAGWSPRHGHGVLDLEGAAAALAASV